MGSGTVILHSGRQPPRHSLLNDFKLASISCPSHDPMSVFSAQHQKESQSTFHKASGHLNQENLTPE